MNDRAIVYFLLIFWFTPLSLQFNIIFLNLYVAYKILITKKLDTSIFKNVVFKVILLMILIKLYTVVIFYDQSITYAYLIDFVRLLSFINIMVFGYIYSEYFFKNIDLFVKVVKFILVVQCIVILDQLLAYNLLSDLYMYGKARADHLRSVGTLANPNLYAFFILQLGALIYLFDRSKYKTLWVLFSIVLIFFASSKSIILLTIVTYWFIFLLEKNEFRLIAFLKSIVYILCCIAILYLFLKTFEDSFLSTRVIIDLLEKGPSSLTTLSARFEHWEAIIKFYLNGLNMKTFLFGSPIFYQYKAVDNSYMYIVIKYGMFGVILCIYLLYYLLSSLIAHREDKLSIYLLSFIVINLLVGLQADSLVGFLQNTWLFLFVGFFLKDIKACSVQQNKGDC